MSGEIAIVVLTHNRVHLLRECVEHTLRRTSDATREIVIWNNGSADGTRAYLDSVADPRISVVHHSENIGQNAYAMAFPRTTAPYLLELDDDVIEAPVGWDKRLLDAFLALPEIGFLAATPLDDENDALAQMMYRVRPDAYIVTESNGVRLLLGPTPGFCSITSRELHDRVGGFGQRAGQVYWLEDASYIEEIQKLGYSAASLADLLVHHAGGPYYSSAPREKIDFWDGELARWARKDRVKGLLLRVPPIRVLNERYRWFRPPDPARVASLDALLHGRNVGNERLTASSGRSEP
jgi:GT2 family glycosyltransferase